MLVKKENCSFADAIYYASFYRDVMFRRAAWWNKNLYFIARLGSDEQTYLIDVVTCKNVETGKYKVLSRSMMSVNVVDAVSKDWDIFYRI